MIQVLFYFFSFFAIAAALFSALSRNIVHAVFSFFITLFSLAGLYVLASADLLAVVQVMVYVGAVVVLILFGLMLSSKEVLSLLKRENEFRKNKRVKAYLLAGALIVFLFLIIREELSFFSDPVPWMKKMQVINSDQVADAGVQFMSTYLFPLEFISIILLMVLIGAAYLARTGRSANAN